MKWIALLFILLPMAAFATDAPSCKAELALDQQVAKPPLTDSQVDEIIGTARIGEAQIQLRRAVTYLLQNPQEAYELRIANLRALLEAITQTQLLTWTAHQFYGPNDTVGFVGDAGYFIWLTREGRIFKGQMSRERDINKDSKWNGSFDAMDEVKPQ